jgi:uncharacterized membrane protein
MHGPINVKIFKFVYSLKTFVCGVEITYEEYIKIFNTLQYSVSAPITLNVCIFFTLYLRGLFDSKMQWPNLFP